MKKRCAACVAAVLLCLCGCERSVRTDVTLFCEAFNTRADTLCVRKEDVFFPEDGEAVLYADNVLLRLQTDADNAVHTAILTAEAKDVQTLKKAAECAFACLAEPFDEQAPGSFLAQIEPGRTTVLQTQTSHFLYLLYRSPESVTVLQWNRQLSEIPSLPALHPTGSE